MCGGGATTRCTWDLDTNQLMHAFFSPAILLAAALLCIARLHGIAAAQGPRASDDQARAAMTQQKLEPAPFADAREFLESLGVNQSYFDFLADHQPLDGNEQEALLRILYALRRFEPLHFDQWTRRDVSPGRLGNDPHDQRGQLLRIEGRVRRVSAEKPVPQMARRFELMQYYRCEVDWGDDTPAVIYSHTVPRAWKIDEDITEPIGCDAVFLKLAGPSPDQSLPLFVAQHLAWYPDNLLGKLGMDVGLFDTVKTKAPITSGERECFYQLLAAMGRADAEELARLTQRPPEDDYSVVVLFNQSEQQVGKLVALTGTCRRAMQVRLDPKGDTDIIARFGFDHYYQLEIFTADSQGNPLVFCLRELPAGMPLGPSLHETVRIPAVFYKSWAYERPGPAGSPASGSPLAPMLIGRSLVWYRPPQSNMVAGGLAAALFLAVLAGLFIGTWYVNRADRRFHQSTIARHARHHDSAGGPQGGNLPAGEKPDFSGLG